MVAAERHFGQPLPGTPRPTEPAAAALASPAADPEAQQRIGALEAELAEIQGNVHALQEQLQDAQASNQTLRSDLAAAELQLQRGGQ